MVGMRTLHLALGLALFAAIGCSKEASNQGGVKIELKTAGFQPGCVEVTAADATGKTNSAQVTSGLTRDGTLEIAVLGSSAWGPGLTVTAQARELSCTGAIVARTQGNVTLPKTGVATLPLELDAVDRDGDGYVSNAQGALSGTDCDDGDPAVNPGASEVCNGKDDNCNNQIDENVTQTFYVDADHDGFGNPDASVQRCSAPADSGFADNGLDCDDSRAFVHPKDGGEEACDGLDDDCDGRIDGVPFNVGDACDAGCAGTLVCAPDGGASVCHPQSQVYVDDDHDGHGTGSPLAMCAGNGFALVGDDCEDGDPFTYPGAPEICDGRVNSCTAGTADQGCTTGTPAWASSTVGTAVSWLTASAYGVGQVWIAGTAAASNAYLKAAPDAGFVSLGGACASLTPNPQPHSYWGSSWAAPWGSVYVGGDGNLGGSLTGGAVAKIDPDGGCSLVLTTLSPVSGVFGFPLDDGGVDLYATAGPTVVHNSTLNVTTVTGNPTLTDIHGMGSTLAAVGGSSTNVGHVYLLDGGTWVDQTLPTLPGANTTLNGVWVAAPDRIYAVGNGGTFLRFNGTSWTVGPSPGAGVNMNQVLAFGTSDVYVASADKTVRRFSADGGTWTTLTTIAGGGQSANDITGASPDDLWVPAQSQVVLHWHEP
jgi:hypothetical protein